MKSLKFQQLPLLLPIFFALHCIDEFPTFISFGDRHGIILPPSNQWELAGAMAGFLLFIALASFHARRATGPGDWRMHLWMVLFGAIYLHAIVNVAGCFITREYAPGAIVSGFIYLPFGIYLARRSLKEGWLSWGRLALIMLGALVFYVALAAGLIAAGKALRGM